MADGTPMPPGILSEVLFGVPPLRVIVGGFSRVAAMLRFGGAAVISLRQMARAP